MNPSVCYACKGDSETVILSKHGEARKVGFKDVVKLCPLHAAAPRMLETLRDLCDGACWPLGGKAVRIANIDAKKIETARALLREIKSQ